MSGLPFPATWFGLAILAIGVSLVIRIFLSILRGLEKPSDFSAGFLASISGKNDHWQPFVLGCIELFSYPILFQLGESEFVGAWLGLKTLAGWKQWSENRKHYNLFLIGNALVLIVSFLVSGCLP